MASRTGCRSARRRRCPTRRRCRRATRAAGAGALLEVRTARKQFGGLVAVNDLSFAIRPGEILGLIGPNGAGKSTMFNLISGALPLTAGDVVFRGESIAGRTPYEIARARHRAHVSAREARAADDACSTTSRSAPTCAAARASLRAALRLDRAEEARTRAEAARAIARVGLAAHMHDAAGSLPLGQQRIVEIARALAADPALLLLDEPAAGLRFLEKQELAALLRQLQGRGMTMLLVEHDMDFVMGLTDRLVVMDFGEKLAEGAAGGDPAQSGACSKPTSAASRCDAASGRERRCSRSATCTSPTARSRPCTTSR